MSDLIERQSAMNVFEILADKMTDEGRTVMAQAISVLRDLSSAKPEQTAKVENIHMEYASEGDFDIYECGDCENCGETVMRGDKFCHECGARLEWK